MARATVTIHLHSDDRPNVMPLDLPHRPLVLHLQGVHQGPSLIGTAETMRRLHDALGAYLAAEDQPHEAEAA